MSDAHRVSSRSIVGRDEPLRVLDELLAGAVAGEPRVAVLAGEAGVGKTRLVTELEAHARGRDVLVLHGESVELGGESLPYAPVAGALRDLPQPWVTTTLEDLGAEARAALAGLLPRAGIAEAAAAADATSAGFGQARLGELLLHLLGRAAQDVAPVLLVLEDMHWADRSSWDLVAFLARNLRAERLAIALTYRTGELEPGHPLRRLLTEMTRRPVVTRIDLAPLGLADVSRQLDEIAGGPVAARLAEELHVRSGGNPFLVEELFAAHRAGGEAVPETIAEAVSARAGRLSPAAQELLTLIAAAGGRATHEVLDRAAGDTALGPALREALDAGLLVRDAGDRGVVLRHGLIGEVLYAALVPRERTELHRRLGGALAATGAPAAELAPHWHRAGAAADALAASVQAGLDAERVYAFAEARAHLECALELWDAAGPGDLPVDRVELLARAAQAARFSGDRERAVELAGAALGAIDAAADPLRAARLYERLGEYQSWDDEAALGCYRAALDHLPPEPSPERARLLAAEGHALMGLRRWDEARGRCETALAVAREAGDEAHALVAGLTLGLVLAFLGEADAGERELRRALATAERAGAGEATARAYVHLGELLRLRGDHAGALEAMVTGERVASRLGMQGSFGQFMFVNAADDLRRLGRWDEAVRRLAEAERMDLGVTAATMLHATAGHLHALRGDAGRARAHLERARELAGAGLPAEFLTPIGSASAALALAERDPVSARRHVAAALAAGGERDVIYTPELLSLGLRAEADAAERARALRRDGDRDDAVARAGALLAALDELLARFGGDPPPGALAHRALAEAERARAAGDAAEGGRAATGRGREAAGRWGAAAAAFDALGDPAPAAYSRLRHAEALLTAGGDRRAAAELLAAAGATAAALGARPLHDEIAGLARRGRVALDAPPEPAAAPREPAAVPPDALPLTAREADVLELLAAGLTNREIAARLFITEKTVGTHVAHIYEKLGVHSRVEAAGRAHALGVGARGG